MAKHLFYRRILKEYKALVENKLPGITLVKHTEDLTDFVFRIKVNHANHIYSQSDLYHLSIRITPDYPVDSPQVQFILFNEVIDLDAEDDEHDNDEDEDEDDDLIEVGQSKIPMHPHIYSNGHICLNLLGEDWSPACSIETIVLSIQSMLNSNDKNERPPDDVNYVKYAPVNPKKTTFVYHDDAV
ncbi:ubiquitin-conjugating enzyme/RWD-like protein [Scheffersomyces amazonensis]|uniref:ubiquitin-conjugating enzyme/RWD-like protein n=1 Tax=Scheffersomyces amazonensis TaxID=1078765 RepID=UPI00315DF21D